VHCVPVTIEWFSDAWRRGGGAFQGYNPSQVPVLQFRWRTRSMDQHDTVMAAMCRAEPAVAAGVDPYAATGLPFILSKCSVHAYYACVAECPHLLTALIEKYGVDVNCVVEGSWQTLMIGAAIRGSTKCIAVLLSHGADVNLPAVFEGDPVSPLHAAAQNGHVAVCRQLLEAGADLEFRGELQSTPLHFAAQCGKVGVIALLMQRGADTHALDSYLYTPIMVAVRHQQLLCVQALLPHADLAHCHKHGSSLLHIAAVKGGPAVLEAVLPRYVEAGLVDIPSGVDADNMIPAGRTPLMSACLHANYAEAKMLLKASASRYAKDSRGNCPLYFCLDGTSMACLRLLLGTAPNWHYTPEQLSDAITSWPLLVTAVGSGSADACKLLITAGADTHTKILHEDALVSCADLARSLWPERPELAALFDPGAIQEPFTPPCCVNCQKSGIKLSACSKCHAAQYCSTACQRAHWRAHKASCISPQDVNDANVAKYKT
jgi:Ankyrin repeats (3 copies)/MYND finger